MFYRFDADQNTITSIYSGRNNAYKPIRPTFKIIIRLNMMPQKTVTSRIYLKMENEIKTFYWVTLGKDKSVYFGSSLAITAKKGFWGENHVQGGVVHINGENSKRLSEEEIKTKYSLHNSGVFISPLKDGEYRKRSYTIKLPNYNKAIPLAGIIPKKISKYPITKKKVQISDLVIDVTDMKSQPFSITLYIKESHHMDPSDIYSNEKFDILKFQTVQLGPLELGAVVYANSQTFKNWPDLEFTCTPEPEITTKELPWVVFEKFS